MQTRYTTTEAQTRKAGRLPSTSTLLEVFSAERPLRLESSVNLGPVHVDYETYGTLNHFKIAA